jgi:ribosomal protein S2
MLAGRGRDLRLMIVLDTSSNSIALSEAVQRGVPTVALASGQADMSPVTYPVLARDFSPEFVHFFLDMLVKVANVGPRERSQPPKGAEAAAEA